jgi:NAD(P)-dependent dehydrogenase (short-subunit alcohol dehydrogenase family)
MKNLLSRSQFERIGSWSPNKDKLPVGQQSIWNSDLGTSRDSPRSRGVRSVQMFVIYMLSGMRRRPAASASPKEALSAGAGRLSGHCYSNALRLSIDRGIERYPVKQVANGDPPLVVPRRNWGRILFISSESAVQIPTEMIHYGMIKTQLAVSRGLAESFAGTGITVNCVLPGPTRSRGVVEMLRSVAEAEDKVARRRRKRVLREDPAHLID